VDIRRDERATPLSLETYRRMGSEQLRYEADRHALNDGTFAGFCLGVIASSLAWMVLSGGLGALIRTALIATGHGQP
jgi:hypothetical protein